MAMQSFGARLDDRARAWIMGPAIGPTGARRLGLARKVGALVVAGVVAMLLGRPVVHERLPPLPPTESDGTRYGVILSTRKIIYGEIARQEAAAKQKGKEQFPDDPWSAQDHAQSFVRDDVRDVSGRRKISLSQGYLIFDEGMHERWPVPRGKPLDGSVVPLHPRRAW